MTREELLASLKETFAHCFEIAGRKNADYAGDQDALTNFVAVQALGVSSVETGFLTRMTDKFTRLVTLIRPGAEPRVLDETINDTLTDIINYAALLKAWLERNAQH